MISVSAVQFRNALIPILVKLAESFTSKRFVQPLKALSPIIVTASGIWIFFSDAQDANAPLPMDVTDSGIVTVSIPGAVRNMFAGIAVIPSSRRNVFRFVQPKNTAWSPLKLLFE